MTLGFQEEQSQKKKGKGDPFVERQFANLWTLLLMP
jgi:hypothetical protein